MVTDHGDCSKFPIPGVIPFPNGLFYGEKKSG